MLRRLLLHDRLAVRFLTLFGIGVAVLYVAWALAYALLPEAVLRGKSIAARLASDQAASSLLVEFARIAILNVAAATLFVLLPNRLTYVSGYPLGYLPPVLWSVYYGALLGSNSFNIAMPERLAPSWSVFARSGVYEIAAYCMLAVSTQAIALSRTRSVLSLVSEPVVPPPAIKGNVDKKGIVLAAGLLLGASLWEAYRIRAAT